MNRRLLGWLIAAVMSGGPRLWAQDPTGSVRGVVYDKDFGAPLPNATISAVEPGITVTTTDQGNYLIPDLPAGRYTLVFAKEGYLRQVRAEIVVTAGQMTEIDVWLPGDFTDMEEFVVQDLLQLGEGSEQALLQLRVESPALLDSIGIDLMSRAGASDAASALKLVAGATVKDGKSAVIRGLPDRYVSSQLNGVRLPSADEDKRAVELDQFPSAVISSIQVSKTFTPDQQGDASGGAVDVRLKGLPRESFFEVKGEYSFNSQVRGRSDFLSYEGGGVNFLGRDDGRRDPQLGKLGRSWDGAVGVSEIGAPIDHKWSAAGGWAHEFDSGVRVGGFASVFYERDSSFFDNGRDDSWWVDTPGEGMVPKTNQGTPIDGDFKTALFDVTQGSQQVQWGGLASFGVETENHFIGLSYLHSQTTEDTATRAEDTRGKEYFFPGYDPNDPEGTGNTPDDLNAAPYLRLETLEYTERTTSSLQLHGEHRFGAEAESSGDWIDFGGPELDWTLSSSSAGMDQPDKRQFGSLWLPPSYNPGVPPWIDPFTTEPTHNPYKPGANFNLGNLQRIWKKIEEDSSQYALNLKFPFRQWTDDAGYLKFGLFDDSVERTFDQDTYSNFGDNGSTYTGGWNDPWSGHFGDEEHPVTASEADVDYRGELDITAWYGMVDLPLTTGLDLVTGARIESTGISVVNDPEEDALWYPPGSSAPVKLNPGDADVDFSQQDLLPSVGLTWEPTESLTLRGSYAQTIARQNFKELTPIIQQEFLGGPIFIGNPELRMSELRNYDLRADYDTESGGLMSLSWFYKDIEDPIEYVQRVGDFTYTTAVNYPTGRLSGWELELRQELGEVWEDLSGFSLGANGTLIDSTVDLPEDEQAGFNLPGIQAPMSSRDMTSAPEHLYNLYLSYDDPEWNTRISLFWTVQGDTLITGAGQSNGNFVPSVYAKEYGTLNLSVSQPLGDVFKLTVKAKNLTNPAIQSVYRSEYIDSDVIRSSYTKGIDFSVSISAEVTF